MLPNAADPLLNSADAQLGTTTAAADPAYWLPFTICCARNPFLEVGLLVQWGLLALALRCLAARDAPLRCVVRRGCSGDPWYRCSRACGRADCTAARVQP